MVNIKRQSIRPITIARIIEIGTLTSNRNKVDAETLKDCLGTNLRRATELLAECCDMGMLIGSNAGYELTDRGKGLLRYFNEENWEEFGAYFYDNYQFYRRFIQLLREHEKDSNGLTYDEMVQFGAKVNPPLNSTAIDVLSKLAERIGHVQRHLYYGRFYVVNPNPTKEDFVAALISCYDKLNIRSGVGLSELYVEIPRIREDACERVRFARRGFDELFLATYRENIGPIELSGAPVTTKAKESRYAARIIRKTTKEDMISPKFDLEKERAGIELRGKAYFYVAIHDKKPLI